jgi:uncharacterized protein (DUF2147 family)
MAAGGRDNTSHNDTSRNDKCMEGGTVMTSRFIIALAVAGTTLCVAPASAAEINGLWLRDTGASRIRFAPCGGAVCGTLAWIKPGTDTPAKVGQRIYSNMKPDGPNSWAGTAFNPEDGKTYKGKMSLSGNTLTTSGCVLGGLICKTVSWSRVN